LAAHRNWEQLKESGRRIFELERTAEIDPHNKRYWEYIRDPKAIRLVDGIDLEWLNTVPMISSVWERVRPSKTRIRIYRLGQRLLSH
jgi:hypothetical protein